MYNAGIIIPVIITVIEMGLNKLQLRFRHAIIVFMTTLIYMLINWLGTIMYDGRPIYPSVVVWHDTNGTKDAGDNYPLPGRDMWNSYGLFFCIFVLGNPLIFLLLALIHRYKYTCCKGDQEVGRAGRNFEIDTAAR